MKTDTETNGYSRRDFLKATAAGGAVLIVGVNSQGILAAGSEATPPTSLNPFVKVDEQGVVTVVAKHFEMGQGTTTGLTTLVAEEMNLDWDSVQVEFAPANNELYKNLLFGSQGTGGSTAIANSFEQYRKAGAAARDLLVRAASSEWQLEPDAVTLEKGVLRSADKSASIGELVVLAATLTPVEDPPLKSPADFIYIGNEKLPRKDSNDKTDGTGLFAMDVKVPDMAYVTILRSPKFAGRLKSFDAAAAQSVKGFIDARAMPDESGVAVYADSTWAAIKARRQITADWDYAAAEVRGMQQIREEHQTLANADPHFDVSGKGNFAEVEVAAGEADKTIETDFEFPLLAHAPMEPLNCVIEPDGDGVIVHDGCQFPALTHPTVAAILDIPAEKVSIRTYYAGGSFGRRANLSSDYHAEAAMAYALLGGSKAVKLVWTREDDLAGGYYRPMALHKVKIGVGNDGGIKGWAHRIVTQSLLKGTPFEQMMVQNGVDHTSVEGVAPTPYGIEPMAVGLSDFESAMKVLWWRSVGHTHTAYAMEVLMDMAAEAAGVDPVEFRLSHLDMQDPDQARVAGVLKLAAEKADWDNSRVKGKGRGIAVHKSFESYVAEVADVSLDANGAISIDRFTCAVDCGTAVNPDVIRAQMEGGIGFGLGAVMRNQITLSDGVVEQANFPHYAPLRISDMPHIDVHIVASDAPPTGVGEPGVPPAGPALANAIYAATGKRITRLPMDQNGIKFA